MARPQMGPHGNVSLETGNMPDDFTDPFDRSSRRWRRIFRDDCSQPKGLLATIGRSPETNVGLLYCGSAPVCDNARRPDVGPLAL